MMPNSSMNKTDPQLVDRQRFVQFVQAGLESQSFQFIRQAAMSWLASYPGDLEVNLLLVQALVKEGHDSMAIPILEKIIRNDTEYMDALRVAETLYQASDAGKAQQIGGIIQALGSAPANSQNLPGWGSILFLARQALTANNLDLARENLMQVLTQKDAPSLAGIVHLQLVEKEGDLNARLNLGRVYHQRWPDCIQISLLLAKTWVDGGNQDEAVNLFHECAALDPAGQVPRRLWGDSFDFKPLYPEKMQIVENFALPAAIASRFGLNHLASGSEGSGSIPESPLPVKPETEVHSFDGYRVLPTLEKAYPEHPRTQAMIEKTKDPIDGEVQKEFEKIADHLKTPSSARADNRFPAYVILSTKTGLTQQYGQQSTQVILDELTKLSASIQKANNWHAFVFLPDDLTICGKYGITPVDAIDPWKIKLALADLDAALAKTGEMIGCVLIIGGDKVVPFHNLPNPTDDSDATVPSDNPYGSLDKNYFVGDWPVGRLPGDASSDSGLLLDPDSQYHPISQ